MTANAVASKFCGTAAATSAIISAKPDGVGAGSHPLILAGEQSLSLMRIAATESVSLRVPMKIRLSE